MILLKRIHGFLRRFLRGEDVVLAPQMKEQWERQFASGVWERLKEGQPNTAELARLILDYARTKPERIRVLDVGCGNGGLARRIADAVNYTGIDIAESAVVSARRVAPRGTFIVGDAMNPPENLGIFDVLVFSELLYYLDPRIVLPRYRTHANTGAQIYISIIRFWRSWFLWRRIKQYLLLAKRFIINDATHRWDIAICTYV
jgi:SAM-dependent methyltransferase